MEKRLLISKKCNNNCVFCGITPDYELFEDKDKICEELKKGILEGYDELAIEGREPTLHGDLEFILKLSRRLGYKKISMITNGRRFSIKEYSDRICKYLDKIFISAHGDSAELHDNLTQAPGSFDQLVKGISNIYEAGISDIAICTVVVSSNCQRLDKLLAFFSNMNVKNFEFLSCMPIGQAKKNAANVYPNTMDLSVGVGKAIVYAEKNDLDLNLICFPFCTTLKTPLYSNEFHNQTIDSLKCYVSSKCDTCSHKIKCGGVWKDYLELFGEDNLFKNEKSINCNRV